MRKCVREGFKSNSWECSFPQHQRQSVSCREMFSLGSPVKLLWTYKRYEAEMGGGFGKGGLPEGSLLLLLLFKRQSCSESTSDGKRAYDNKANRCWLFLLLSLEGCSVPQWFICRLKKKRSNFKGPLMEIWLWEDLSLVFRCENDSEIDHHRLRNRRALRSLGLPLSFVSFARGSAQLC